ncbi:LpqB family beta-propeller domain-containing protein [bacterium]|nr:LpqB family beta-propeller domain-containing protein [bacterium]MCI0602209.1 LpqB family beta-propeller domain-containing protein [bacterium]
MNSNLTKLARTNWQIIWMITFAFFVSLLSSIPADAAFPGANGKIAFESRDLVGGVFQVYVMDADGSNVTRLTDAASNERPAWSPDGAKIAFVSSRDAGGEIYIMNADGSNQTRLTNTPASSELFPSWSADGSKITFESDRDGNFEIYVMNADGTNQTRITNDPAFDAFPAWSPDGTKIAFTSERDGNREIYVMNTDGTNQTNLTNNPANEEDSDWSPDGSKILFTSDRTLVFTVFVMDSDGSNQTPLTDSGLADSSGVFSPDGTKIAFLSARTGNVDIFSMDADGTNPINLTNNSDYDINPDWQPLPNFNCPHPKGFWKEDPSAWPVSFLTLGSQLYTSAELLSILNSPIRGDASLILAHQLISAKLNIANGSNPAPVSLAISDADSLLSSFFGKLPYDVRPSTATGRALKDAADTLSNYNQGELTPGCEP